MKRNGTTVAEFSRELEGNSGGALARMSQGNSGDALLVPETLLPSQLPSSEDSLGTPAGVRGLMLAILEDAVYCLADTSNRCAKRRREARLAETWIRDPREDWVFSFVSICRVLDLDPDTLRFRLLSVPPEDVLPDKSRRRRSHRVERGKRKRRARRDKSSPSLPPEVADVVGGEAEVALQAVGVG